MTGIEKAAWLAAGALSTAVLLFGAVGAVVMLYAVAVHFLT